MSDTVRRPAAAKPPALAALILAAGLGATGAAQAETTPYYLGGSVAYTHLSNALGLADNAAVPTQLGYSSRGDDVTTLALVGGLDQRIGRQRLFGDVTLRDNRYADNALLDSKTYSATAGMDWETVQRISGNVTLRSNRELIRYGVFDQPTGERNLATSQQADVVARIGAVTLWTFEATAGWRSIDYSAASYAPREFRQTLYSLGTRLRPGGPATFGLTVRESDGRYPRYTATQVERFDRRDIEVSADYRLSGLTSLYARASHTRIDYELTDSLDFSGFIGALRLAYAPGGKLRLSAELARDRAQDLRFQFVEFTGNNLVFETFESADLATALRLRASYDLTAKVALTASAGNTRRAVALLTAGQQGREHTTNYGLGVAWTPTRTSRVGCDWAREQRRSDLLVERLNTTISSFGCYGQLTIQP